MRSISQNVDISRTYQNVLRHTTGPPERVIRLAAEIAATGALSDELFLPEKALKELHRSAGVFFSKKGKEC